MYKAYIKPLKDLKVQYLYCDLNPRRSYSFEKHIHDKLKETPMILNGFDKFV